VAQGCHSKLFQLVLGQMWMAHHIQAENLNQDGPLMSRDTSEMVSNLVISFPQTCKHIVVITLLQGLADNSYPTWLHCISPNIFCDPTVFNDEGQCEALGIVKNKKVSE
jgi:hypothetical protein